MKELCADLKAYLKVTNDFASITAGSGLSAILPFVIYKNSPASDTSWWGLMNGSLKLMGSLKDPLDLTGRPSYWILLDSVHSATVLKHSDVLKVVAFDLAQVVIVAQFLRELFYIQQDIRPPIL
jgi:hypothetical protein